MAPVRIDEIWQSLAGLRRLQPANTLPLSGQPVAENLSALGGGLYLLTRSVDGDLRESANGPLVHSLLWAPSHGTARMVAFLELDADDGRHEPIPPLIAFGWTDLTYGRIPLRAREEGRGPVQESARYDPDGRFVLKTIAVERTEFCFRGHGDQPEEAPFAVVINPLPL